jgi:hypothetical protein
MPKEKQNIRITVSDGETVTVHVPEGSNIHVEYQYDSTEWAGLVCERRPTVIGGLVGGLFSTVKAVLWFFLCLGLLGAAMHSCL